MNSYILYASQTAQLFQNHTTIPSHKHCKPIVRLSWPACLFSTTTATKTAISSTAIFPIPTACIGLGGSLSVPLRSVLWPCRTGTTSTPTLKRLWTCRTDHILLALLFRSNQLQYYVEHSRWNYKSFCLSATGSPSAPQHAWVPRGIPDPPQLGICRSLDTLLMLLPASVTPLLDLALTPRLLGPALEPLLCGPTTTPPLLLRAL